MTCKCKAVTTRDGKTFPHHYGRACYELEREERDNRDRGERTQAEINAEALALFDAAEARAINSRAL